MEGNCIEEKSPFRCVNNFTQYCNQSDGVWDIIGECNEECFDPNTGLCHKDIDCKKPTSLNGEDIFCDNGILYTCTNYKNDEHNSSIDAEQYGPIDKDNDGYIAHYKRSCPLGCNTFGTECAACDGNKCENGSLKKCKDDKTGYEEIICPNGCNKELTACDNNCTTDSCVGGQIYHCKEGKFSPVPEKCPDIGDKPGSCANATKCRQCDETQMLSCVSEKDYNSCDNGLLSGKTISCPEGQFCTAKGCKNPMEIPCLNNNDGTGQIWENINNVMTREPCPNGASCKADGDECGECLSNVDTKCEDGDFYKCVEGQYKIAECPLGLGCHTVSEEKKLAVCNECSHDKCAKSSATSEVGYITKCINYMWDEGDDESGPCEASNGKYVSCQSESECGECKNGDFYCKDENTTVVCQDGKWVNGVCEGIDQICDIKTNKCIDNPNHCTPGKKVCIPGDKDTPQTAYRECQIDTDGKSYWGPEIKCEGKTPICINHSIYNTPCVECDVAAKNLHFEEFDKYSISLNSIGGSKCDPDNELNQFLCLYNSWVPKDGEKCKTEQICKETSVVALNEKGEYVTVYAAICAKREN